jgi:hypothetical protein
MLPGCITGIPSDFKYHLFHYIDHKEQADIGPLINLGTQHNGRSARTWMKRILTTFVLLWEGEKDLLESTKMDFYET